MADAARYMIVLGANVAEAKRGIQEVHEQARGFSDFVRQGFGIGAGVAAFQAGMNMLGGAIGAAKSAMVDFNSDMQKAQISFEAMLGSAEKAQAYLAQLQQFAATTPFEFPELMQAARKFMNVGIAAESVIPILTRVGDAVAQAGGGREEIEGVSRALTQMVSQGKVQAEEMEQLAERSIPAWRILAEYLGKTEGQVRDMVRSGQVSANQFLQAFDAFYAQARNGAGAMEKMSHTWEGALSTIRDNLRMFGATAFEPIFGRLTQLANKIAEALQSEQFQRFTGFVQGLFEMAGQAIDAFMQRLAPIGQSLSAAFEATTRGDFSGFANGLADAVTTGLNQMLDAVKAFGAQMFGAGAEMVGELVNGITSAVGSAFNQASEAVAGLLAGIIGPGGTGTAVQTGQAAGTEIGQGVAQGVQQQAPAAQAAGQQVAEAVKQGLTLDQIPMDLQGVKDLVAGAADNMGTLQAASERVKETVRGISAEMLNLQMAIAPLRMQLEDVKRSYDEQIQSVRDQIDAVNQRHSAGLEEQRLAADLAVLEAQRALEIAKGDQAVRQRLDAEIQELQIQQRALALENQRAALAELRANPPGHRSPAEAALEDFKRQMQLQDWADREAEISRREKKSKQKQDQQDDDREYKQQQEKVRRQREEQQAKDRQLQEAIRRITEQEAAVRAKYRDMDLAEERTAQERKRQMREQEFRDRMEELADELAELDVQQRRVSRMGGRGMYDALRAIEKQRKNLLKQQQKLVDSREEEKKQEEEQARKAERKRLMEAELAVLDAQKKALEEQRRQNREIISDISAGLKRRTAAAKEFEAFDSASARARLEREKKLAELQAAVDAERLAKAKEQWERRVKEMELALAIAEKEAERNALNETAAIRQAEAALRAAEARQRELNLLWQIEEAENRIAAKPLQDRLRELEAARRREVEALEDQLRPLERQLTLLGLQRQQWEAIGREIKEATDKLKEAQKGQKDTLNLGKVEIDMSAIEDFKKKLADGQKAAQEFIAGFGAWIRENLVALGFAGIGALIGGAIGGPLGALVGAAFGFMFGKTVQERLKEWGIDPNQIWPRLQELLTEMARLILPRLKAAFDDVKKAIEFLWPYLVKIGQWMWENRETIATVVEWWIKLRVAVWGVQVVFGLLAAVLGVILSPFVTLFRLLAPILPLFKGLASFGARIVAAFGKLGPAVKVVAGWFGRLLPWLMRLGPLLPLLLQGFLRLAAIFTGPVGWAILGVVTAIGLLWTAWQNWDTIKPIIDEWVGWLGEKLGGLKDKVVGWFSGWEFPDIGGAISRMFEGWTVPDFAGIIGGAINTLVEKAGEWKDWIAEKFSGMFSGLSSFSIADWLPSWESITTAISGFFEGFITFWTDQWDSIVRRSKEQTGIKDFLGGWAGDLEESGHSFWAGLLRGLESVPIVGGLINAVITVGNKMIKAFKDLFGIASPSTVFERFGWDILNGLLNGLVAAAGGVIAWFATLPGKMMEAFNSAMASAGGWGSQIAAGIKAALDGAFNTVVGSAQALGQKIVDTVSGAFSSLNAKAQGIGSYIAEGMQNAWSTARGWTEWLAQQITGTLGNAFDSVKSKAAAIGMYISQGFSEAWGTIRPNLEWLRDQIVNPFSTAFASFRSMAASIGTQIANGFGDAWTTIRPNLEWLRDQMVTNAGYAVDALKAKLGELGTIIADRIYNAATPVRDAANWLVNQAGMALDAMVGRASSVATSVGTALGNGFYNATQTAAGSITNLRNAVEYGLDQVKGAADYRAKQITDTLTNIWTSVTSQAQSSLNNLNGTISSGFQNIQNGLSNMSAQVGAAVSTSFNNSSSTLWSALQNISNAVYNTFNGLMQSAVFTNLVNFFTTLPQRLWDGWRSAWDRQQPYIDRLVNGFEGMVNAIKSLFGISSPSRVMRDMAANVIEGWNRGLEQKALTTPGELIGAPMVGDFGSMPAVPVGGTGGAQVVNVYVQVDGSVIAQMDLVEAVRQGLIEGNARSGYADSGLSRVPGL